MQDNIQKLLLAHIVAAQLHRGPGRATNHKTQRKVDISTVRCHSTGVRDQSRRFSVATKLCKSVGK